jgi:hypothetical protein
LAGWERRHRAGRRGRFLEPSALLVFGLRVRNSHTGRQAAVFEPDYDDEKVAFANLVEADLYRLPGPGPEELHRIVPLLDAANGVEHRVALLLEVVERAADKDGERRGRLVFPHELIERDKRRPPHGTRPTGSIAVIASEAKRSSPAARPLRRGDEE